MNNLDIEFFPGESLFSVVSGINKKNSRMIENLVEIICCGSPHAYMYMASIP